MSLIGRHFSDMALPSGNWRTAEFWGEVYLDKYAAQLKHAMDVIEPGE